MSALPDADTVYYKYTNDAKSISIFTMIWLKSNNILCTYDDL